MNSLEKTQETRRQIAAQQNSAQQNAVTCTQGDEEVGR